MKNKISKFAYLLVLLFPSVSFAAFSGINTLLTDFGRLVTLAIPIAFALGLLYFFYGVGLYILRAGDEKAAKEGKSIMIYGVIALFVMASIWGLVGFIGNELGIRTPVQGGGNSLNGNCFDANSPDGSAGC